MTDGTLIGWAALLLGFALVCVLAKIATTLTDMHDARERDRADELRDTSRWLSRTARVTNMGGQNKVVEFPVNFPGGPRGGDAA